MAINRTQMTSKNTLNSQSISSNNKSSIPSFQTQKLSSTIEP